MPKFYTHRLNLIERTKLLEGVLCQSLSFTNQLPTSFPYNNEQTSALVNLNLNVKFLGQSSNAEWKREFENLGYVTPIQLGNVQIYSAYYIMKKINETGGNYGDPLDPNADYVSSCSATLYVDGELIQEINQTTADTITVNAQHSIALKYNVKALSNGSIALEDTGSASFVIGIREEPNYPTKPNTITSAINRILDLAEPLFATSGTRNYTPRFTLNPVQAEKWDDVLLPDTTLTQCTLREQLQHIGNYVHAQVRLGGYYNGEYQENMIFYDEYGQEEISTVQGEPYVANVIKHSINEYNTQIDTNAENIVNTLDYADGVIIEPDSENFRTIRTETSGARLSESNCIIETQFPIYDIISVKVKAYDGEGGVFEQNGVSEFEIKDFVLEINAYNNLTSYGGGYPYSKSYALNYTQGQKNIGGLFFKPTDVASEILGDYVENYAITNILQAVAPRGLTVWKNYVTNNFPYLSFQVTYIPYYDTRYSHTNSYIVGQERKLPFTKIYNQSENAIETRFYGENIKGVAERLGNKEATRTYYLGSINKVPKTGTKLDDYYISSVVTEYMQQSIRCTVGLTERFNRLSQNVGINSTKRVYEVSNLQAYKRNILLKEYICIGDNISLPLQSSVVQQNVESTIQMLKGNNNENEASKKLLTTSVILFESRDFITSAIVKAPIVSSAFGNVMTFSWQMKDNYSAGSKVDTLDGGYWQSDVAYGNYYGRAKNVIFQLADSLPNQTLQDAFTSATQYSAFSSDIENTLRPYLVRKDSREILRFNLSIEYATNRKDLIICSALASCNPHVSNSKRQANGDITAPYLYLFNRKLNKYTKTVEATDTPSAITIYKMSNVNAIEFTLPNNVEFDSWAIAYEPTTKQMTVYNEDTGENEEITITTGGEILIACNNGSDYYASKGNYTENLYVRAYSDKLKEYESV